MEAFMGSMALIIGLILMMSSYTTRPERILFMILSSISLCCAAFSFIEFGEKISKGYPTNNKALGAYNIYEIVYAEKLSIADQETETGNEWITLMRMTNGQYRLFTLDSQPSIGLVKVNKDRQLEPFPVESQKAEASTQEVENSTQQTAN